MKRLILPVLALAIALPTAVSADPGKGKQGAAHGASRMQPAALRSDKAPVRVRAVQAKGTPPGLAKKPYGMPPGQAKKVWSQGEQLPNQYYTQSRYFVANPTAANLAPAPYGSRWVRVGDNYYLAQTQTGAVGQIISALIR